MGATSSFIRFGADIEQRPDLSVTELKRNNNIVLYYINLIGISVNGYMLNIPEQEFEIKKDGSGGSIIDSGAAFSHIRRAAHDSLLRALEAVLAGYGDTVKRVPSGDVPFELWYEVLKQEAFQGFPVITFHLQNSADIILDAESAFLIGKGTSGNMQFYLAIISENDPRGLNAIGAYQQTNYRFIYDTKSYKLFFGAEDCFRSS
ncbi:hypothetical protein PRUPE_4G056900 [Prunus persica]|uniref:Peptidase A1 domain-containing protein n=1 Tax=Prunus persica TaxID=3760 RepID=A0A251PGA1_PRUPE|nr:hypothetical protein PRUPE_4G056900 [Prunus persica]